MSSKTRRFLVLALTAIMLAAMMGGCNGSGGSGNSGTGSLSGSGK